MYIKTLCIYIQCYDIETQTYDASRLFTTNIGPLCGYPKYYNLCPKCDCDGRNVGDIWYVETQTLRIYDEATCAVCECKTDENGNNYADCDNVGNDYIVGSRSCPIDASSEFQCHSKDRQNSGLMILPSMLLYTAQKHLFVHVR